MQGEILKMYSLDSGLGSREASGIHEVGLGTVQPDSIVEFIVGIILEIWKVVVVKFSQI